MTYHAGSRRELAALAAALLLPIPLLVASGLVLPLPSGVERGLVSLVPGLDDGDESNARSALPTSTSSTSIRVLRARAGAGNEQSDQPAAGVLSEGGNAVAPAAGNGAADGATRPADMLPGDERRTPGGGDGPPPPSAAPDSAGSPEVPKPSAPAVQTRVTAGVAVDPGGLEVDVTADQGSVGVDVGASDTGVSLTADIPSGDGSSETTVVVPVPAVPLPTLSPLP